VLPESPQRKKTREAIEQELFECIRALAGTECADAVRQAGLEEMHRYFPKQHLPLVSEYLTRKTGKAIIQMGYATMIEDFAFGDNFYVEATLAFRFHYPISTPGNGPIPPTSASSNDSAARVVVDEIRRSASAYNGRSLNKPYEDGHALHRDYWFGYALNTLNFWWALGEVEESNGMLLYPATTVKRLTFERSGRPYLDRRTVLTRPQYTPLKKGEMLAITSHTLHATNLNTSGRTRVVVSIRITPGTPQFAEGVINRKNSAIHRARFHPSSRIAVGDYDSMVDFTGSAPAAEDNSSVEPEYCRRIEVDAEITASAPVYVCESTTLGEGQRLHVSAKNIEIALFRTPDGLCAISARCPHENYNLSAGYCDAKEVVCPGHGLKFRLANGTAASHFAVDVVQAYENDGKVFLRRTAAARQP